jgi:hypothetical protein
MTWDDALSINCFMAYLRRTDSSNLYLCEFCVDYSAFLKSTTTGSSAGTSRSGLHDTYFDRSSPSCLLDLIKVKPRESGVVTNTFLQEARLEAEHLLVINHFSDFLASDEYQVYVQKLEEMNKSAEALDTTSRQLSDRPKWAPDSAKCMKCATAFNAPGSRRRGRHHCRACGMCVCDKCCPKTNKRPIPSFGYHKPVRHCNDCMVNWQLDKDSAKCAVCSVNFTLTNRRHHCRNCGKVVCSFCSPKGNFASLPQLGYPQKVRICDRCTTNSPKLNYRISHGISRGVRKALSDGGSDTTLSDGGSDCSGGGVEHTLARSSD